MKYKAPNCPKCKKGTKRERIRTFYTDKKLPSVYGEDGFLIPNADGACEDGVYGEFICYECGEKYSRAFQQVCVLSSSGPNDLETVRRFCVLRMTRWSREDDKRSQDFREGIEKACSDIALFIDAMETGG